MYYIYLISTVFCCLFLARNGKYEKNKFIKLLGDKATFKHIKVVFPTAHVQRFGVFGKASF